MNSYLFTRRLVIVEPKLTPEERARLDDLVRQAMRNMGERVTAGVFTGMPFTGQSAMGHTDSLRAQPTAAPPDYIDAEYRVLPADE